MPANWDKRLETEAFAVTFSIMDETLTTDNSTALLNSETKLLLS